MCGIAGYIGKKNFNKKKIKNILHLMQSRGPNYQDYYYKENYKENIYLLHSRLSIIDLSKRGNQPFIYKNYITIFNGEIYNYIELKNNLLKRGVKFKTNSDTEVLLHTYLHYGKKCLEMFEGMWSFVIYDNKNSSFFISRDRFGEKPMYYFKNNDGFYFGSEINYIKSLLDQRLQINNFQVMNYLSFGYKSLFKKDLTFYKNLKIFPKSCYLHTNNFKNLKFIKYWKLKYKPNHQLNYEEIIHNTKSYLINSFRLRFRSDVPIALCLSGGIDSAGIASISKRLLNKNLKTYSIIDNDTRYSEIKNINLIQKSLKLKNTKIFLNKEDNLNNLKQLIEYKSQPLCTLSYYNHSLMLNKMKKDNIKVCLLGTAADEIFAGYYDHFLLHLSILKNKLKFNQNKKYFKNFIEPFIRNNLLKDPYKYIKNESDRRHVFDETKKISYFLLKKNKSKFDEKLYSKDLLRNRMMNELFHEATPVILNEDDTNSMFYSIENRSPYLDKQLIEFMYTVPSDKLINNGYSKYILRKALDGFLDKRVLYDRKKIGFNSSIDSTFNLKSKKIAEVIFEKNHPIYDYVNYEKIKEVFNMKNKPNYMSKFIFNFINIKLFYDLNEN